MMIILSMVTGAFLMLIGVVLGSIMNDLGKTTITAKKEASK